MAGAGGRIELVTGIGRERLARTRAFLPYARLRHRQVALDARTELVIDGFFRSGNTYAVAAFQFAQPRPVRLAHHLHAPAVLIEAGRRGIPAVLPVREPRAAVLSTAVMMPHVSPPLLLRWWVAYHECLEPHLGELVVAPFDLLVGDFGEIVRRVNMRHGAGFTPYQPTPENERAVRLLVDQSALHLGRPWPVARYFSGTLSRTQLDSELARLRHRATAPAAVEHRVSRPSPERERARAALAGRYDSGAIEPLRRRAGELFRRLSERATGGFTAPAR